MVVTDIRWIKPFFFFTDLPSFTGYWTQDQDLVDTIKKILEDANLEDLTMKNLCRKVYDTYPQFDLEKTKKDFIRASARQVKFSVLGFILDPRFQRPPPPPQPQSKVDLGWIPKNFFLP